MAVRLRNGIWSLPTSTFVYPVWFAMNENTLLIVLKMGLEGT